MSRIAARLTDHGIVSTIVDVTGVLVSKATSATRTKDNTEHPVLDIVIADEGGAARYTLWDDQVAAAAPWIVGEVITVLQLKAEWGETKPCIVRSISKTKFSKAGQRDPKQYNPTPINIV